MASGGRKDKTDYPETPESSTTQSSLPSVSDEAQPQRRGSDESGASRQSRSREKKKRVPSESSTPQSSVLSVDDEEAHLLPRFARVSSTKSSQKKKPVPSESPTTQSSALSVDEEAHLFPSTAQVSSAKGSLNKKSAPSESSTPQSSVLSVDDEETHLLQSAAQASISGKSTTGTQAAAEKRLLYASGCDTFTKNVPKSSPGKSSLAVPDSGARAPSKSPSKSPSTFSQMASSIKDLLSKGKSQNLSTDSKSPPKSKSSGKTYPESKFGVDPKSKSPKNDNETKSPAKLSAVISRGDLENTRSSTSSDSSGRKISDVSQPEVRIEGSRLNVPESKKSERNPLKCMVNLLKRSRTLSVGREPETDQSCAVSKSSSKSATSSSSVSPVSRNRQASDASNISWENSRTSNSKSSSTSGGNRDESLRPEMGSQFLKCSPNRSRSGSCEGSSSDSAGRLPAARSRPGTVEFARSMLNSHVDNPCPSEAQEHSLETEPVTERLDNLHFEDDEKDSRTKKLRRRPRSCLARTIIKHIRRASKARKEEGGDLKGATDRGTESSDEISGATASTSTGRTGEDSTDGKELKWRHAPQVTQSNSEKFHSSCSTQHGLLKTRHESLSPKCKHRYIFSPGCSEVRIARERRKQRKCRGEPHINNIVTESGKTRSRMRINLLCLRSSREALLRLEEVGEQAAQDIFSAVMNVENWDTENLARLNELGSSLTAMQNEITAILQNVYLSRIDEVGRLFLREDDEVTQILNEMDITKLEESRESARRLRVAHRSMIRIEPDFVEIRNVILPRLLAIDGNLQRIQEEAAEIQGNIDTPLLRATIINLSRMEEDIKLIFKRLGFENKQRS